MIVDWDQEFTLHSIYGDLDLNASSGDRYILDRATCQAGADYRFVIDNVPARSGGITHRVPSAWYSVSMAASLWVDEIPACDGDLNRMVQNLQLHLLAMRDNDGRLLYTPSGYPERLLDNVRAAARLSHQISNEGRLGQGQGRVSVLTWQLASPFPYLIDATENCTPIMDGGGTTALVNDGTTDFYPVVHVYGPTTGFTLTNETTGLSLIYDSSLPGASVIAAGKAVEFDFFRETAYFGDAPGGPCPSSPVNGPYTGSNAKPGIDVLHSDFFPLTPVSGGNTLSISGADCDVLYQAAWG